MDSDPKSEQVLEYRRREAAGLIAAGKVLGQRLGYSESQAEVHASYVSIQCWSGGFGIALTWEVREPWLRIELVRALKFPAQGFMPFSASVELTAENFKTTLSKPHLKLLKRLARMISAVEAGRWLEANMDSVVELLEILRSESGLMTGPVPPPIDWSERAKDDQGSTDRLGWMAVIWFLMFSYFVTMPLYVRSSNLGTLALIAGILMSWFIYRLIRLRIK